MNMDALNNWLKSTPEFIYIKDLNGKYQILSNASLELMRAEEMEDAIGKTAYNLFPKELAKKFIAEDELIKLTGKTYKFNFVFNDITYESTKAPLKNGKGKIIGIHGITRDVTEAKKHASRRKALLDNIPPALWIKEKNDKYSIVNKTFESFYNIKKENIINKDINSVFLNNHIVSKEMIEELTADDKEVMKTGKNIMKVIPMFLNGKEHFVDVSKSPIYDENKEITGILGLSYDITERVKEHEEIIKAKEKAESANSAKSEFLANMTHEIKTPMNGIMGFLHLLETTTLNEEQQDYVNEIKKSSELLLNILNGILDLSKIEAGKMTLEFLEFNIPEIFDDIEKLANSMAQSKYLKVNTYYDYTDTLIGDSFKLKQILINLINNAVKFTETGEITISSKLLKQENGKAVIEFSVEDTGIGISKENQEKIFESFTQADSSTTRKYGGTGLGLTISKNLVQLMNGTMSLKSTLGKGSTFSFTAEFDYVTE